MQQVAFGDSSLFNSFAVNELFHNKDVSYLSCFEQSVSSPELIKRCDSLFREIVERLNRVRESEPLSPSEEAHLLGRCTKFLREMDDAVSDRLGYPLHRYCCCHVKEDGVQNPQDHLKSAWPTLQDQSIRWTDYPESFQSDEKLKKLSATLISWSLGGGHNVVRDSFASRLAARGMHVYKVAADEEVLKKFDFVHNVSGGRISSGDVINFLMRHNFWFVLSFINWFFGSEGASSRQLKTDEFLLALEKRGDADLVITCFDRYLSAIEKSAYAAGRPILSIASDYDPDVNGIDTPADIHNPDFLRAIMVPPEDQLAQKLQEHLSPDQIRFAGLPVRDAFLKDYSEQELADLRKKYQVEPDAQAVVLVAGGQGVQNGYAKLLKEFYEKNRNPEEANSLPKIHLFVVTGKNQRQKDRLDITFKNFQLPQLKVKILGWMDEKPMGELAALAAQPVGPDGHRGALVSAKGGGGTLSDAAAAGAPLVVCDRNPISWEQGNIDYVCRKGLGRRFVEKREFVPTLLAQLNSAYTPEIDYRSINSVEKSIELVKELLQRNQERRAAAPAEEAQAQ